MSEFDYEALEKARAGATPGPWDVDPHGINDSMGDVWLGEDVRVCENATAEDAALIALAPDMADELMRMREGITLIERINYMEGRDATWRAAKMNAVAYALSNGDDIAPFRRLFPRTAGETNDQGG